MYSLSFSTIALKTSKRVPTPAIMKRVRIISSDMGLVMSMGVFRFYVFASGILGQVPLVKEAIAEVEHDGKRTDAKGSS